MLFFQSIQSQVLASPLKHFFFTLHAQPSGNPISSTAGPSPPLPTSPLPPPSPDPHGVYVPALSPSMPLLLPGSEGHGDQGREAGWHCGQVWGFGARIFGCKFWCHLWFITIKKLIVVIHISNCAVVFKLFPFRSTVLDMKVGFLGRFRSL